MFAKTFFQAAKAATVPQGTAVSVSLKGHTIALFNIDGSIYAIDDKCPYDGGSLSQGNIQGKTVRCPDHGSRFDLKTGNLMEPPSKDPINRYETRVQDGIIEIAL